MRWLLLAVLLFQDAPKMDWRTDVAAAIREASEFHKPMIVYFRGATCKNSKALEAGPLASAKVVEAAAEGVPVWVDVDKDAAKWREKYDIRFTPTLLVLDRAGRRMDEICERDEEGLARNVAAQVRTYRGPWCRSSAEAFERGRAASRPVILVFWDDKEEKPHTRLHPAIAEFMGRVVISRAPLRGDEARRFGVDEDKVWIVADPLLEKPEGELLGRIILKGEKDDAALKDRIKRILDAWLAEHTGK